MQAGGGIVSAVTSPADAASASSSARTAPSTSSASGASSATSFDVLPGARLRRSARRAAAGADGAPARPRLSPHAGRAAGRRARGRRPQPLDAGTRTPAGRDAGDPDPAAAPRAPASQLPAILFADLDDAGQARLPDPHAGPAHRRRQPARHRRDRDAPPRHARQSRTRRSRLPSRRSWYERNFAPDERPACHATIVSQRCSVRRASPSAPRPDREPTGARAGARSRAAPAVEPAGAGSAGAESEPESHQL